MPGSTYKVIELVGTSPDSWEDAAKGAVATAANTLQDLRIAEVMKMDIRLEDNQIVEYRVKLSLSFKHHPELVG